MKLKTLKDLELIQSSTETFGSETKYSVELKELRKEAIKYIKEINKAMRSEIPIENLGFTESEDKINIEDWQGHLGSITVFIKHFFNIKDEELKEVE